MQQIINAKKLKRKNAEGYKKDKILMHIYVFYLNIFTKYF